MTVRRGERIKRVCVVSGSRADYGLLRPVMEQIRGSDQLELQLIVTGSHLSPLYGNTIDLIRDDGFQIDATAEMSGIDSDSKSIVVGMGQALQAYPSIFEKLNPDILLVLGDRYEILMAVTAALISQIPVAHIAGGDVTEGAFDDAIRHAITKMAHLHFVTNDSARHRVLQMGEVPNRVLLTGSPGIDLIEQTPLLSRDELSRSLDFQFKPHNLAVTYHPETTEHTSSESQLNILLEALDRLGGEVGLVFTGANSDPDGAGLNARLKEYVSSRSNAVFFQSLGQQRYYSLLSCVDAVVGNSSSGLYEAPSFRVPTINIGSRQDGRLRAKSVVDVEANQEEIFNAILRVNKMDCHDVINPYGDGNASARIVNCLEQIESIVVLFKKKFRDLQYNEI